MRMGAENGMSDIVRARLLPGANRMGCMKMTEEMSMSITGIAACCTSSWLLTMAPAAPNNAA